MKRYGMGLLLVALLAPAPAGAVQVTFKNRVHTSLGAATLTLAGDSLRVANLGSSGNDGVSIAVSNGGAFHMDLSATHIPSNGFMGFFALTAADTLSAGRVSPLNDSMELQVAFKALPGITLYRVEAYLGGALVRSRDIPLGALPITSRGAPAESDICIGCFFRRVANWFEDHASVTHGSVKIPLPSGEIISVPTVGVDFTFIVAHGHIGDDPVPVAFDNIVVYPVGTTVNTPRADQVILTAGNHPGFTIRQEATILPAPMAERSFWILCGVALLTIGCWRLWALKRRELKLAIPR